MMSKSEKLVDYVNSFCYPVFNWMFGGAFGQHLHRLIVGGIFYIIMFPIIWLAYSIYGVEHWLNSIGNSDDDS